MREDRPIPELLRANYTFLNEQLARHYGIDDIYGSHFRRVTLTDERRLGLLGQRSVLTVTSYADRTSVVLRGKWVLENLLGAPPPPPPPNVPPLKENDGKSKPTALRERMEQHRNNAGLRELPLADGSARLRARALRRDRRSGARPTAAPRSTRRSRWTATTIDSPKAFREALLTDGDEFVRHRRREAADLRARPRRRLLRRAGGAAARRATSAQNDYRWSSLVLGIVQSTPFQMRQPRQRAAPTVGQHVAGGERTVARRRA